MKYLSKILAFIPLGIELLLIAVFQNKAGWLLLCLTVGGRLGILAWNMKLL